MLLISCTLDVLLASIFTAVYKYSLAALTGRPVLKVFPQPVLKTIKRTGEENSKPSEL